jgi:prophage antirepressor-like protein
MSNSIQNNNVQLFNFKENQVRILGNFECPIFCLVDICKSLSIKNISDANSRLNQRFGKGVGQSYPLKTAGGIQETTFITEPQLYYLVMRSDKKQAIEFQDWVFNEVLPAIRKNGYYDANNVIDKDHYKQIIANNLKLEQQNLTLTTELAAYKNKISSAQAKTLKQTVEQKAKGCKKAYSFIYHAIYDKFEIPDYKSLPADKYNDCMSFVAGILIPANALKIDTKENLLEQNKTTFFADLKNFVDEILQDLKRLSNTSYLNTTEAAHQKNQIENKLCIIKSLGSTFS